MTRLPKTRQFNVDTFLHTTPMPLEEYYFIDTILNTTRVLDRLYGRQVAQRYFTNHLSFDSIKITVK